MIINSCRSCNSKNIIDFFDLGEQPFANSLKRDLNFKEKFYPLKLVFCDNCSLVQLNYTAPPNELFSDYVWLTSTSQTSRDYSKKFCDEVLKRIEISDNDYILEAASNDGTFLKPFKEKNIKVLGVDPANNLSEIANKDGIETICDFFGVKAVDKLLEDKGQAKVVFARNVLPHIANLHDFVEGLEKIVKDDGLVIIEFHYAKVILEDLHYDSIYHEHLFYYTLKSLEYILNTHNLWAYDLGESPINAGNIILYLKKEKKEASLSLKEKRNLELKEKINFFDSWKNFATNSEKHKNELLDILNKLKKENLKIVGYGASARSSTLLNYCSIDRSYLDMISDQNSLKHNKYTAGTNIPIYPPDKVMETNPDVILLLAWNFKDEIIDILKNKYNFKGKCIIPLPIPYVIDLG
ncbi:MAG: class I SAM-dependent methyltransferase [Candidatus Sericytochromatia bacterium]